MYNVGYEYRKPVPRAPVVVYTSNSYPLRITLLNMRIVLPPFDKCNGHIVDVGQITTHPFSLILPMSSTEVGTTPLVP